MQQRNHFLLAEFSHKIGYTQFLLPNTCCTIFIFAYVNINTINSYVSTLCRLFKRKICIVRITKQVLRITYNTSFLC